MKKTTNNVSFRTQILQYNIIVIGAVFLALLIYIFLNFYTIDEYENAFNQYRHVNGFYESLDNATDYLKDYLYTDAAASYASYEQEIQNTEKHLQELHNSSMEEGWKTQLLSNMLTSYKEQVQITKDVFDQNLPSYGDEYTKLLNQFDLIKKTSSTFYENMTDNMEVQIAEFRQLKLFTILFSIGFGIILIVWLVYYTMMTANGITEPLTSILKNIALIKQGSYDLTKISNTNIEMHELCEALEEMAVNIQKEIEMTKEHAELEKKLLETENENLKKDELLIQSELKMLQNQINPHFLFNTLNMTYKLALAEHATKCSEMIEQISILLRYGLEKQNKMSDLKSEIQAVQNYVSIQEKRLGDRVTFEFFISDNLPNITIPGMILQPLVENSLEHGLRDCESDGEVIISLRYDEPYVYIQISDNGKGMDSEKCEHMLLNGFHDASGEHLGLYNVTKRLEMFYQDQVDISVDSAVDCGFSFTIKIKVV